MNGSNKNWWNLYSSLEGIPDTVAEPQACQSKMEAILANTWRSLLNTFIQELLYEQQIEYLERCISLSHSQPDKAAKSNTLGKFQKIVTAVITA